jgi:16S rRNA (guanine966-N2)-methyltransferase
VFTARHYAPAVRVIAGTSGGRLLQAPAGSSTRPTSDRVREAIFGVLGSFIDFEGIAVADLFAGSGAMGIEALSRGAGSAVFVDSSPAAVRAVQGNLASLGLGDRARVVQQDVVRFLAHPQRFDLTLCDPPYEFGAWNGVLGRLDSGVAVLESRRPVSLPGGWETLRNKRYGGTLVTVVRPTGAHQKGER